MSGARYVCIHGHFYQPPRENPWIELLQVQPSAYPCHDWNERVTRECYRPNGYARILDGQGRLRRVTNNYARMSFNFGPTLLSWLETHAEDVYAKILQADQRSAQRFGGYGSALGQVYNHMIMPLANARDQRTQVLWGIEDFQKRFGRTPQGMWLAETAVDTASLEALAEAGVDYTVLAPHQCQRVRTSGGEWVDVSGQQVDTRRAYRMKLPSGRSIALFFYDGPISRGVAFDGLLKDGHRFAERLCAGFEESDEAQLVHIATDGETYGHHHAHGDMALAAALDAIEGKADVRLTNYGEFLALHPPTWDAEIAEETSWSCAHGVERWRSDCGCKTRSDMHQRWRGPLRHALDELRDAIEVEFTRVAAKLWAEPWAARDAYIELVLDDASEMRLQFWERHRHASATDADRERALGLLELQRQTLLMYTSCGWFFDDIARIEAVQVLRYAARAIDLASTYLALDLRTAFIARLKAAEGNEGYDGDTVFEAQAETARVAWDEVARYFATESLWTAANETLGAFRSTLLSREIRRSGPARVAYGRLQLRSSLCDEVREYDYAVFHLGDQNLVGGISLAMDDESSLEPLVGAFAAADFTEVMDRLNARFGAQRFSIRHLLPDQQRAVIERSLDALSRDAHARLDASYKSVASILRYGASIQQPVERALGAIAQSALTTRIERELDQESSLRLDRVRALCEEARVVGVELDCKRLGEAMMSSLERRFDALAMLSESLEAWSKLEVLMSFALDSGWEISNMRLQYRVYRVAQTYLPAWHARTVLDDPEVLERRAAVTRLARMVDVASEIVEQHGVG